MSLCIVKPRTIDIRSAPYPSKIEGENWKKIRRHERDSNPRSSVYETDALPLGHRARYKTYNEVTLNPFLTSFSDIRISLLGHSVMKESKFKQTCENQIRFSEENSCRTILSSKIPAKVQRIFNVRRWSGVRRWP